MAKQAIALRLDPADIARLDARAAAAGASRQALLESFVVMCLDEGEVEAAPVPARVEVAERAAQGAVKRASDVTPMYYADGLAARQVRVNRMIDRARKP